MFLHPPTHFFGGIWTPDAIITVCLFLWRTIFANFANLRSNHENINREINGHVQRCGHLLAHARRAEQRARFYNGAVEVF